MKKTIFKDTHDTLRHRIKSGMAAGLIIGIIPGVIEGQSTFLDLKGFNDSTWMLLLVPVFYSILGTLYGAILGLIYHYLHNYLKIAYSDFSVILSAAVLLFGTVISLVSFNEYFILPRFHPVSVAIDLFILAAAYLLLKPLSWAIDTLVKIKRSFYAASALLLLLMLAAYDWKEYKNIECYPAPPASRSKEMRLDSVIILMLDTVRADHLSCYGYDKKVSPVIDELASNGVLFERHYSSSSWTIPAHFSLMTGVTSGAVRQEFSISEKSLTLAERIRLLGYRTASFSANPLLSRGTGFDQGFDIFDCDINIINRLNNLKLFDLLSHLKIRRPIHTNAIKTFNSAELVTNYALEWIQESGNEPYFLFINYMDAHDPYLPPQKYRNLFTKDYRGNFTGDICGELSEAEFIRDIVPQMKPEDWKYVISQYDGAIKYIDDQIGRIRNYLEKNEKLENTILIIVSDHGEFFGEYRLATHHLTLSDEETHVPLIIHYPRVIKSNQRVKSLARIIDIYPTLKELLGFKLTEKIFIEGIPLLKKNGDPTVGAPFAALTLYENSYKASILGPAFKRDLFCYRTNEWKYLYPEINPGVKKQELKGNIFHSEQIIERLQHLDINGKPVESPVLDTEKMKTFRYLLNQWREDIKKNKPPLGTNRQSKRLMRDLVDINYIRPY
jgi:arylsulfatase A-like enzyme